MYEPIGQWGNFCSGNHKYIYTHRKDREKGEERGREGGGERM